MEPRDSIGCTIRTLSNLLRRKFMSAHPPQKGPLGSETAGMIMGYLCDHADKQLCQHDVEQVFCIRRSTASRLFTALERDGMVERRGIPGDGRRKLLVPTAKALAIHAEFVVYQDALESCMAEGISQEELQAFLQTARKIEANLSRKRVFPISQKE